jgi:hypothetical protein
MSERITWTTCPHCGESAAVGWLEEIPVEFDCTAGCSLTSAQTLSLEDGPHVVLSSAKEHGRP